MQGFESGENTTDQIDLRAGVDLKPAAVRQSRQPLNWIQADMMGLGVENIVETVKRHCWRMNQSKIGGLEPSIEDHNTASKPSRERIG